MSNQVLNTQRFSKSRGASVNSLTPKPQKKHQPIARRRRQLQISNASFGATVNIEPSMCEAIERIFLKITVSADGSATKTGNWALDIIKQLDVRSGAEQLMHYPDYCSALRYWLSKCDSVKRAEIKKIVGGGADTTAAATYWIPLNFPGAALSRGFDPSKATPLRLASMPNTKRPITFAVTFSAAADVTGSGASTITDCVLEYDELITNEQQQFNAPYQVSEVDIKTFPEAIALGANTDTKFSGLESIQGCWKGLVVDCIKQSDDAANQDKANVEPLTKFELNVDGVKYESGFDDEKRGKLNALMDGWVNDEQINRLSFNRHPTDEHLYEGNLHSDGVKRVESTLRVANASNCRILVECHRTFASNNKNMRVIEH